MLGVTLLLVCWIRFPVRSRVYTTVFCLVLKDVSDVIVGRETTNEGMWFLVLQEG